MTTPTNHAIDIMDLGYKSATHALEQWSKTYPDEPMNGDDIEDIVNTFEEVLKDLNGD